MVQLVKPLQRHQEQLKLTARFDERDTLRMAGPGTPRLNRRSSFGNNNFVTIVKMIGLIDNSMDNLMF